MIFDNEGRGVARIDTISIRPLETRKDGSVTRAPDDTFPFHEDDL